jgi:ubiquinone/menaquinone biosynthesis C-methylase UbiE
MDNTVMQQSEYENIYYSEDKMWWYIGLRDLLLFYLNKYCKKNAVILDAGCGTGKNIEFLGLNNFRVHGIDVSNDAIKFCNRRNLPEIKYASITDIPSEPNFFDAVFSMDVIGNLDEDDREKAIKEFTRVLKPNGIAIINTAAFEWLRSQHDDIINLKKRFNKKELEMLISCKNIQILKSSYRVFLLFLPLALIKWSKRFARLFSKKSYTDLKIPPLLINSFLKNIQFLENKMIRHMNFPFGTSMFIIFRKRAV